VTVTELPISMPDLDDDDDLLGWRNTFATVFSISPADAQEVGLVRETWRSQRLTGVRDDDRWVATFRTWRDHSAVPGGGLVGGDPADLRTVPTELVSSVCVVPTHRRRGLLTRLMADALRHAREDGAVVASLFASEAAIYGRYGYGVATHVHDLTVDTRAARAWHAGAPADPGRVRLSDDDELLEVGPALFEAARRRMPGAVSRNEVGWLRLLERIPPGKGPEGPRVRAVHLGASGEVDGCVRLRTEMHWTDGAPAYKARVDDLVGATPAATAALWRFCVDLDLVTTLVAEHRGHGDLLAQLPLDTRAVRVTAAFDGHWWRVLDTAAALGARAWAAAGRVVVEVVDPGGPAEGRWELDVDGHGSAGVRPTTASADLTLPVQSLPPVLTGVLPLGPMLAAGRIDEHRPGAVERLGLMSRVEPVSLAGVQGF
jgi:predicted acetyltransferase